MYVHGDRVAPESPICAVGGLEDRAAWCLPNELDVFKELSYKPCPVRSAFIYLIKLLHMVTASATKLGQVLVLEHIGAQQLWVSDSKKEGEDGY